MNKLYLCRRGKHGIFHARLTIDGKRTWRTTRTSDRTVAEEVAARMMLAESAPDILTSAMIEALLPDETSRSVFRKYMGRFHDIPRFIGEAVAAKLRSVAKTQIRFAAQLSDEEKEWAGIEYKLSTRQKQDAGDEKGRGEVF